MARLEDLDIGRCKKCGRLIQMEPGRALCRVCSGEDSKDDALNKLREARIVNNFARYSGMSREAVEDAVEDMAERSRFNEAICVRCNQRKAIEDSEFCIYCHLDLYRSLGDASKDLFSRMEYIGSGPSGMHGVVSSLRETRRSTPMSHINPATGPRLRW
ncbi:MAG TPA: hypothetical protein PLI09_01965 [Candidatus Hydrogenedentes bacterium]|nr:hypothetical protein [Candidatus Hydrogenedentota bacterium]